jgi:hypothetical protein
MLGDELEELDEEEATPSYLMPAMPANPVGMQEQKVDELGMPSAPIGNHQ